MTNARRRKDTRPRDRKLDGRTIAFGALIFTFIAVALIIGYILTSRSPVQTTAQNTSDQAERPPSISISPRPAPNAGLNLRVEEKPSAPEETPKPEPGPSSDGVTQDGQDLNVTLDPDSTGDTSGPSRPGEPSGADSSNAAISPAKTDPGAKASAAPAAGPSRPKTVAETERKHPTAATGKETYRVQVGTFADKANADAMIEDLRSKGYRAEVKVTQVEDRATYRVQFKGYKSKDDAEELARDLTAEGYKPRVISDK